MKVIKPVGATADLRELEYISALHQVGKAIRNDGSIKPEDISKFLMSRYGIKVAEDEVTETIAKGFGGGGVSEEDGDTIDLTELAALLLVPALIKAEMSLHRDHLEQEKIKAGDSVAAIDDYEMHEKKSRLGEDVWESVTPGKIRALRGEERWPDSDLIEFVLKMILTDVTGDEGPKPMTKDLLRKIFTFYQEHEVAEDDKLLDEMISVASEMKTGDEEGTVPMLDKFTFAHCLTDDVRRYDVSNEGKLSTNFSDVFPEKDASCSAVKTVWTAPSLDYAVDTFRTKTFIVLLWVNWALFFYVFMSTSTGGFGELECSNETETSKRFGCQIAQGIVNWLIIMTKLIMIGSGSVMLCSMGNNVISTTPRMIAASILSLGSICVFTIVPAFTNVVLITAPTPSPTPAPTTPSPTVPFFDDGELANLSIDAVNTTDTETGGLLAFLSTDAVNASEFFLNNPTTQPTDFSADDIFFGDDDYTEYPEGWINTVNEEKTSDQQFLIYVMVAFGALLLLMGLQNLFARVIPARYLDGNSLQKIVTVGTISMERNMKQASSFKINQMIRNARAVHESAEFEHGVGQSDNSYGRALLAFSKIANDVEETGGFVWTWKRMFNRKLFTEDGIWLNNRMVQGNVGQLVLCLWLIPFLKYVYDLVEFFYVEFLVEILPDRWRIILPLSLAFVMAEFNALKLATSYTPSSVRTTLRYRYGVIGSLHSSEFLKVRTTVDEASFIFGGMFWGCLYSSTLILFTAFLLVGLLCFEPFLPIFLQVVATILGIVITIMIKTFFLILARKRFHERAFYRTNPAAANIIGVVLEAWTLGISTLYVFKRMVFLLSAAFIFVGRIDIPFLSEDADQLGPLTLDNFPFVFRKDLLTHEAHRHPYLERIGVMYMLKLKHGEGFGREAGTSWRLLFVFALLPWLRKYRARAGGNLDVNQFTFSKDGDVFNKFVSGRAEGMRGRRSLGIVHEEPEEQPKEESKEEDTGDEEENEATISSLKKGRDEDKAMIAALRKEVESLREEILFYTTLSKT